MERRMPDPGILVTMRLSSDDKRPSSRHQILVSLFSVALLGDRLRDERGTALMKKGRRRAVVMASPAISGPGI